ncbi:hypothetical protein RRG08_007648 [Elysia crispata]|uniref:Uncharacterized protein n=1 Tax=Elysia crispata TaxID=231223 RepID=A0AAE0Y3Q0_9GAST|nr:hypothetical protein RRG08_007648 [Elysia crispata]
MVNREHYDCQVVFSNQLDSHRSGLKQVERSRLPTTNPARTVWKMAKQNSLTASTATRTLSPNPIPSQHSCERNILEKVRKLNLLTHGDSLASNWPKSKVFYFGPVFEMKGLRATRLAVLYPYPLFGMRCLPL